MIIPDSKMNRGHKGPGFRTRGYAPLLLRTRR
jgi:hypothetical protein